MENKPTPRELIAPKTKFTQLVAAAIALKQLTDDSLNHAQDVTEANAIATKSLEAAHEIIDQLQIQLAAIITGEPCPCQNCTRERAEAMAQAEAIFK